MGQVQRVALFRKGTIKFDTVTPANNVPSTIVSMSVAELAAYTILLAADTLAYHLVFLPLFGGDPVIAPGEANTFGGADNSTLNGQTYHLNFNPSTFSARFDELTAPQIKQMRLFTCEQLEAVFVNGEGKLIFQRDGDFLKGIDISGVPTLGGRAVNGFGSRDANIFGFQIPHGWDENFEKVTPTDFNALTI